QSTTAEQGRLGHWVAENVPRHGRLALNDIGAIAYISRRPVIDLMGLVTPEIIPYRRQGEDGVIRFVGEQCPDYVIVFPAWFPNMTARRYLLEPIHRVHLEHNEVAGADEMVVYRLVRCAVWSIGEGDPRRFGSVSARGPRTLSSKCATRGTRPRGRGAGSRGHDMALRSGRARARRRPQRRPRAVRALRR